MAIITRLKTEFTGTDTFDRIVHSLPVAGARARFLASDMPVGQYTRWNSKIGTEWLDASPATANKTLRDVGGIREAFFNTEGVVWQGFTGSQPYTMAGVIGFPSVVASGTPKVFDGGGINVRRNVDNKLHVWVGGVDTASSQVLTTGSGVFHTFQLVINGASSLISVDGVETTFNAGTSFPDHQYIGGAGGGDVYSLRELIWYPSALTLQQRTDLRNAMASLV